jgi:protein-tyrosine phosphatase
MRQPGRMRFNNLVAAFLGLALVSCDSLTADRFYPVDEDSTTGFAIYRSNQPDSAMLKQWCAAGITEIFALNGEASKYEQELKKVCPTAKVVYNVAQDADSPTDAGFLAQFDQSVEQAKLSGGHVLIHCSCGCHRTGRLAAYYRMKYNDWTAEHAIQEMNQIGDFMAMHPSLPAQVRGMDDFIHARACDETYAKQDMCVQPAPASLPAKPIDKVAQK